MTLSFIKTAGVHFGCAVQTGITGITKDNAVSFGLRDMTRRFRDCLGR